MLRVVVDTREQHPYTFPPDEVDLVRRKLSSGDYSIEGLEARVAIERKNFEDYIQSLVKKRARFMEEVKRLSGYQFKCIIVEGSLDDVASKLYTSDAHPNSILGSTTSLCIDFNIPVHFCGSRQSAAWFALDWLQKCNRSIERKRNDPRKCGEFSARDLPE